MTGEIICNLVRQGLEGGSCQVNTPEGKKKACQATLRLEGGRSSRLISAVHLSRPENYLSIYQSGCNFSCRKCHSYYFSKEYEGSWYSPEDIVRLCEEYEARVTLIEPRERATAWHAQESCRCCGWCKLRGRPSPLCPGVLTRDQVTLSPQGWGPVRNIVGFTGGDLLCQPAFYVECVRLIKEKTALWVLLETNGYGLTDETLILLRDSGVDAFWLDIKAYDEGVHRWLTGCTNRHILGLPEKILSQGFVLEVLSLYIPGLVERDQLRKIAGHLTRVSPDIPFTILAFFPVYLMTDGYRPPNTQEMVSAYEEVKATGLKRVRLGNVGVFAREEADYRLLRERVDPGAY